MHGLVNHMGHALQAVELKNRQSLPKRASVRQVLKSYRRHVSSSHERECAVVLRALGVPERWVLREVNLYSGYQVGSTPAGAA